MKKSFIKRKGILFSVFGVLVFFLVTGCQNSQSSEESETVITDPEDMGKNPWVLDIEEATVSNSSYRLAKWSGEYMQMVLMSLKPGEIIDPELHGDIDQFIRIEEGEARVLMGKTKENLSFDKNVSDDWAIFIPAGYWHEVRNTGNTDLKLYTIYAPGEHASGIHHETYDEAAEYHHDHDHDH